MNPKNEAPKNETYNLRVKPFYLRFLLPSFLEAVRQKKGLRFLKPNHSYKTEIVFFSL